MGLINADIIGVKCVKKIWIQFETPESLHCQKHCGSHISDRLWHNPNPVEAVPTTPCSQLFKHPFFGQGEGSPGFGTPGAWFVNHHILIVGRLGWNLCRQYGWLARPLGTAAWGIPSRLLNLAYINNLYPNVIMDLIPKIQNGISLWD